MRGRVVGFIQSRRTYWAAMALVIVAPALAGCGESTKRALGWEHKTPDEFTVVTRAPLSQPPDFNLRPPANGTQRTLPGSTSDQARKVLVGSSDAGLSTSARAKRDDAALVGYTAGEQSLLKKAGAVDAKSDIRKQVDEETTAL